MKINLNNLEISLLYSVKFYNIGNLQVSNPYNNIFELGKTEYLITYHMLTIFVKIKF